MHLATYLGFEACLVALVLATLSCRASLGRAVPFMIGIVAVQMATHAVSFFANGTCNPVDGPAWCNSIAALIGVSYLVVYGRAVAVHRCAPALVGVAVGLFAVWSHLPPMCK